MELQLMSLVAQGIRDKEIAAMMHSTERHVSRMRRQVTRRLEVQGRCELALYGLAARNAEV
jgi:DNA-binding NarL/FixJ family response regulator